VRSLLFGVTLRRRAFPRNYIGHDANPFSRQANPSIAFLVSRALARDARVASTALEEPERKSPRKRLAEEDFSANVLNEGRKW
jgi:hypothetical protein